MRMSTYVVIKPLILTMPDAHIVNLVVGNQTFLIGDCELTREDAEFMRNMLCLALENMVEDATTKGLASDPGKP